MRKILILLCGLILSGCSIYQIHIQQGNAVDATKVEQLQLGMSKQQVKFLLGTAMLQDSFHQDRWDYLYRLERGGKPLAASTLTLFFDNDRLNRIDDSRYQPDAMPKP
ncbi:MAG: outer membrane protein assembly factor BamE [Gammaproteobacteria bacterium]